MNNLTMYLLCVDERLKEKKLVDLTPWTVTMPGKAG